jgi:hypothetical protein
MTCQWCVDYRRRGGSSVCVRPGGDGQVIPRKGGPAPCKHFRPRRSCTTCALRCSPEDKASLAGASGCQRWTLREVESWGGYRRTPDWRARKNGLTPKKKEDK